MGRIPEVKSTDLQSGDKVVLVDPRSSFEGDKSLCPFEYGTVLTVGEVFISPAGNCRVTIVEDPQTARPYGVRPLRFRKVVSKSTHVESKQKEPV